MKWRPSYAAAIQWIAKNEQDTHDARLDVDTVYAYTTVEMVADLFNLDRRIVATDVVRERISPGSVR